MHRRVNRRRDRPDVQARSSLPRSSHLDRVGHPAAATVAASCIQYAASVLCGDFCRCTPQIRARIAPHCSRHIRPRHARQREGNENSVPRPFVCAGLFAHEKEEVRRKENRSAAESSSPCRPRSAVIRCHRKTKGGGGRERTRRRRRRRLSDAAATRGAGVTGRRCEERREEA